MRKGDLDAAIPRFEEAAHLRPDWGKPLLLLGDVYERKHDPASAVKYYKEYLRVYPHAPEAKKIRQKIGKLSKE
jgi:tetratricopeptide (TPR) repeat protein